MGQYYYVCNITKKEFLHPHHMGDGLKLMEFGLSAFGTMSGLAILLADGTMSGLAILLADGNGRGGGDIEEDPVTGVVGRWAGDKIVIAGDYADEGKFVTKKDVEGMFYENIKKNNTKEPLTPNKTNLNNVAGEKYKDISNDTLFALMADNYSREQLRKRGSFGIGDIVKDFDKIHMQLAKNKNDLALLVGQLKTEAGKNILGRFFKLEKKPEKNELI